MLRLIPAIILSIVTFPAQGGTPDTVFLEELTMTEVRDALSHGITTIIIPTAGTEQNGPHMVLGKHKYRMNAGAERIARALGNALVAPVITYVPEGDIDPPSGHMRFPGTISVSQSVFKAILEHTSRSFKTHGFLNIILVGDSGGNQAGMKAVAETLNKEWQGEETRVHFVSEWYSNKENNEWLKAQGYSDAVIGRHAGLKDTATLLAVAPEHVRTDIWQKGKGISIDGVDGDPTVSTVAIGQKLMDLNFEAAMKQIRTLLAK